MLRQLTIRVAILALGWVPLGALAQIDGHGPDAWRVHGVAADDVLNARMGPGTNYPIIGTFDHDARGLQQITCVPLYTMAHREAMSEAEYNNLPPRWCLMRSGDLNKAGWVAQRYLVEDGYEPVDSPTIGSQVMTSDDLIARAQELVWELYEAAYLATVGGPDPLNPANAINYFSSDVVAAMQSQPLGANPLYGAQDFDGSVSEPVPDPEQPMLRGMITINVEIVNFGRPQTAIFRLRADPTQPGAPIRIFRIDHEDWSFP